MVFDGEAVEAIPLDDIVAIFVEEGDDDVDGDFALGLGEAFFPPTVKEVGAVEVGRKKPPFDGEMAAFGGCHAEAFASLVAIFGWLGVVFKFLV